MSEERMLPHPGDAEHIIKMNDLGWTEERVETLKSMHAEGASAPEIARALGGDFTRNAVIGKIHRLRLQRKRKASAEVVRARIQAGMARSGKHGGRPSGAAAKRVRNSAPITFAPPKAEPEPFIDPDDGIDVTDLVGLADRKIGQQCAYIHGDPLQPGAGFCGKPVREGSEYCDHHHRRTHAGVWQP